MKLFVRKNIIIPVKGYVNQHLNGAFRILNLCYVKNFVNGEKKEIIRR